MYILAISGTWQIIFVLVMLSGALFSIRFIQRFKRKVKAQTPDKKTWGKQETQVDDVIERLEKLNQLREAGALTDEEFEVQKEKVLG